MSPSDAIDATTLATVAALLDRMDPTPEHRCEVPGCVHRHALRATRATGSGDG